MEQSQVRHHVRSILNQELLISLATTDGAAQPWASVVEFAADENFTIYWLSDPNARHSQNVAATNRAAGTITLPLDGLGKGVGLQLEGTVRHVTGEEVEVARKLREAKRGQPIKPHLLETRYFYALTPDRIYLLHEPLLGYSRAELQCSS